jgi:mono/diheme cytochrome c family protein
MKTIRRTAVAVLVLGGLGGGPALAQEGPSMAEGARQYGATCGRCHNPRSPVERSDRDWVVIANHMRARAGLTGEQVSDILAFLQANNHVEEAMLENARQALGVPEREDAAEEGDVEVSTDPELVERGRELTSEKGCVGCHVIGSEGGRIGPALNDVIESRGATFVARKLRNPAFDNEATLMPDLRLSDEQIRALIAYLATLR